MLHVRFHSFLCSQGKAVGGTEFDSGQSGLFVFILPLLIIFFLEMKWDWEKHYSALH